MPISAGIGCLEKTQKGGPRMTRIDFLNQILGDIQTSSAESAEALGRPDTSPLRLAKLPGFKASATLNTGCAS
jgi:hypothetical protein